jgi:hypothetical protein
MSFCKVGVPRFVSDQARTGGWSKPPPTWVLSCRQGKFLWLRRGNEQESTCPLRSLRLGAGFRALRAGKRELRMERSESLASDDSAGGTVGGEVFSRPLLEGHASRRWNVTSASHAFADGPRDISGIRSHEQLRTARMQCHQIGTAPCLDGDPASRRIAPQGPTGCGAGREAQSQGDRQTGYVASRRHGPLVFRGKAKFLLPNIYSPKHGKRLASDDRP